MEVPAVDQRDIDRGAPERACGIEPAETSADVNSSCSARRPSSVPRRGSSPIFWPFILMRCQSAGEIGCLDVSAGFSFPHLHRSPDFDGRPRFATMMQFPCPWSSCPNSPIPDRAHVHFSFLK